MSEAGLAAGDGELYEGLLGYLPSILYQRRWFVLIPALVCSIAGVTLAYTLPAQYRSAATVLVESKDLPDDIATSPLNDLIDQRIARIKQQVLSRPDLIDLIQKGKVQYVVNTTTKGKQAERDGFQIRRMSVENGVPCLTSMDTVEAILKVIESMSFKMETM